MSKLKIIKKVLIALILISTIVFLDKIFVKNVRAKILEPNENFADHKSETAPIFWNAYKDKYEGVDLLYSNQYYCIEHGQSLFKNTHKFYFKSRVILTSNDNSQYHRAIAKILYDAEKAGKVGYNKYSKYQVALWMLIYDNKSSGWVCNINNFSNRVKDPRDANKEFKTYKNYYNNKYPKNKDNRTWNDIVKGAALYLYGKTDGTKKNSKEKYKIGENEYTSVWYAVKNKVAYTGDKKFKDSDIIAKPNNNPIKYDNVNKTVNIKLSTLYDNAKVTDIKVNLKNDKETEPVSVSIKEDKVKFNNWIGIYVGDKKISVDEIGSNIKQNNNVIIKNQKDNQGYIITSVTVTATTNSGGFAVATDTWERSIIDQNKKKYLQRLMSAQVKNGKVRSASVTFTVNQDLVNIKVIKEGIYKEKDLVAQFKLYCEGKGFVKGKANEDKIYTNDETQATTYESGVVIDRLLKNYNYKLIEVGIKQQGKNWQYYTPIKMKKATIKYNGIDSTNLIISDNSTIGFKLVEAGTQITIQNDETTKDLKIIKQDKNTSKRLNGAVMKLYVPGEGWLTGTAGSYSFIKDLSKEGANKVNGYETKTIKNGTITEDGVIELKQLPKKTYYVYETVAPNDYNLIDQFDKHATDPNNFNSETMVLLKCIKNGSDESKYCIDLNEENGTHTATYNVNNTPITTTPVPLEIIKIDSNTNKPIQNVQFGIYYENKEGSEGGWLSGENEETFNYNADVKDSIYTTNINGEIKLNKLKDGTYYIYERAVPAPYLLSDQEIYKSSIKDPNEDNSFIRENGWIFLGCANKDNDYKIDYKLENTPGTSYVKNNPHNELIDIEVTKVQRGNMSAVVKGAQMKIYSTNNSNEDGGWLVLAKAPEGKNYNIDDRLKQNPISIYGDTSTDVDDIDVLYNCSDPELATVFETDESGQININGLADRKYYFYEIKAPDDDDNNDVKFDLTKEPGYMDKRRDDPNKILNPRNNKMEKISVVIGAAYLKNIDNSGKRFVYVFENTPTDSDYRTIDIIKENINDSENKLNGTEMKLYYVDNKGNGNWIGSKVDGKYELKNTISEAKTFVTGTDVEGDVNKDGRIRLEDMPLGTYYVIETKAPDGFELSNPENPEDPNIDAINEYVQNKTYLGRIDNDGISFETQYFKNIPTVQKERTLKIIKMDPEIKKIDEAAAENKQYLKGAEFKICAKIDDRIKWVINEKDSEGYYKLDGDISKTNNTFVTDDNGIIYFDKLRIADYYIYETKAPEGYKLEDQKGYMMDKDDELDDGSTDLMFDENTTFSSKYKCVFAGISSKDSTEEIKYEITVGNSKIVPISGYVWEDAYQNNKGENKYNFNFDEGENKLEGISVELYIGDVAKYSTTTNDKGEYIFDKNDKMPDYNIRYKDLEEAYIKFYYNNDKFITVDPFMKATTKKVDGENITELERKPAENIKNNSKAQKEVIKEFDPTETITDILMNELDDVEIESNYNNDNKLKNDGYGTAVTYMGNIPDGEPEGYLLTQYFNEDKYAVEHINLGLIKKIQPTYVINENIKYVKIKKNGFTYYYNYSQGKIEGKYVPAVQAFLDNGYGVKLPPSDLASHVMNTSDSNDYEVYVVYYIDVTNDVTENIDCRYVEDKLYLKELTQKFDPNFYTISTETSSEDEKNKYGKHFNLWNNAVVDSTISENNKATTSYKIDSNDNIFKDGISNIEGKNTKTTYIQFKLNDAIIKEKIFKGEEPETKPSVDSLGYHEYLRTDNVWNYRDSVKVYSNYKPIIINYTNQDQIDDLDEDVDEESETEQEEQQDAIRDQNEVEEWKNNKHNNYEKAKVDQFIKKEKEKGKKNIFVHKSKYSTQSREAYYIKFSIGEQRTISGTIFEDFDIDEDPTKKEYEKENLGNGMMDNSEKNRAKRVTVELLNANQQRTTLYSIIQDESGKNITQTKDAKTETKEDGTYEFKGVVPGYYYIRFNYGLNDQKIIEIAKDGTKKEVDIKSTDYRSTIINTKENEANNIIMDSIENTYPTKQIDDNNKKYGIWYKNLNSKNYSTAVDFLDTNKQQSRLYSDYINKVKEANFDKNNDAGSILAYTPIVEISIENDINDSSEKGTFKTNQIEGFNLGLIKQKHDILIEKSISNVEVTSQMGSKLLSDDPTNTNSIYIKNNPGINSTIENDVVQLAQDVSIETEPEFIYGSLAKTTYKIAVQNYSPIDYIENEGDKYYGYYYKYGKKMGTAHQKKIKLDVYDFIDPKYQCDDEHPVTIETEEGKAKIDISNPVLYEGSNEKYKNKKYVNITGWGKDSTGSVKGLASGEKAYVKYSLAGQIGDLEKNTNYNNDAQVAKLEVDKLTTIESNFEWKASDARLAIFPDTGENRSYTFLIVGVISFATLAIGFVLIKKKVLN